MLRIDCGVDYSNVTYVVVGVASPGFRSCQRIDVRIEVESGESKFAPQSARIFSQLAVFSG